jgi:hypothetical protein
MMYKNKFKARQTTMGNPLSSTQRVAQYLTGNFFSIECLQSEQKPINLKLSTRKNGT